jgi:hypothetical protein
MSSSVSDNLPEGPEPTPEQPEAPEPAPKAAKRPKPVRLKAAVLLPLLFGGAAFAYWFTIDGILERQLTSLLASYAGEDGEASVDSVRFSIFGPKLTVNNLRAWQNREDGEHEVVYLGHADLDIEFWPLLERRLVVNNISASEMRFTEPIRDPVEPEDPDLPEDPENDTLNEYLDKARDFLMGQDVETLRGWLEKLQEYTTRKKDPDEADKAPRTKPDATAFDPGPSDRAWYVREALLSADREPRVLVKRAALDKFSVNLSRGNGRRLVSSVTDLALEALEVSSDPVAYGRPMQFTAAGNLDGDAERRVELGLLLRWDPTELVTLEQVDGSAKLGRLDIAQIVDPGVFGDTLRDAHITLKRYAPAHPGMSGRARLQVQGLLSPPGLDTVAQGSFALWFGGHGAGERASLAPSGISVQIEDFPLGPILGLAGGSPLPVEHQGARITFGTCDERGNFGTPGAALSWHDGLRTRLRVKVTGARFTEQDGDLGGLPAAFVARGLNRVVDDLGGLDVVLGFNAPGHTGLNLERPGLRAFSDAVINALSMTPAEIESVVDLPFSVDAGATVAFTSVNPDGSRRDPQLALDGDARHDFGDLRVSLNLSNVTVSPRPGQDNVAGLPAADFCRAFNTFMQSLGEEGLNIRTRLLSAEGVFSPALESPGTRGLVDAMIGVLDYTGAQLNEGFDLPFTLAPGTRVRLASVDADGTVRGLGSPGADRHDLTGLRVRLVADNLHLTPRPGHDSIMGLPAADFCKGFNAFLESENGSLTVVSRIFDGNTFRPALESPGTRGLVDATIGALSYTGAEFAQSFDLPVDVNDDAMIRLASVDADGTVRGLGSPGADRHDLGGLRVRLVADNLRLTPRDGHDSIMGLPAADFCKGFNAFLESENGGLTVVSRIFDGDDFRPALESPGTRGLVDASIGALAYTGAEFARSFDLPFKVNDDALIRLASVDSDGTVRGLGSPGADRHDLDGLRVRLVADNLHLSPRDGHDSIAGLPAGDFCKGFNAFLESENGGLTVVSRIFDGDDFRPALESPGTRGLVDASIGALAYTGAEFARSFDLPFKINDDALIRLASVDADGAIRGLSSTGADRHDLGGLRVRAHTNNMVVSPKEGEDEVAGIPADQFCHAFNTFLESRGEAGVALDLRVWNDDEDFDPALERPGARGLLDGVANSLRYNGKEANEKFDLPFKLSDEAVVTAVSLDEENKPRTMDGPDSDRHDLRDFILGLNLRDAVAAPKEGTETIMGIPATNFTFAWNKLQEQYKEDGFPVRFRLFDNEGKFKPTLAGPSESELLRQLGNAVGIDNFQRNFGQLAQRFPEEYRDFQDRGIDAARDILGGRSPAPRNGDTPRLPDPPELPPVPRPPIPRPR